MAPSRLPSLALMGLSAILLASCGGDSGGGVFSPITENEPNKPFPSNFYVRIAEARPRAGSVTQSSNINNGITVDSISVDNSNYPRLINIINNGSWSIGFISHNDLTDLSYESVFPNFDLFNSYVPNIGNIREYLEKYPYSIRQGVSSMTGGPYSSGDIKVMVSARGRNLDSRNYLVLGSWGQLNCALDIIDCDREFTNPQDELDFYNEASYNAMSQLKINELYNEIGVFVDGGDPFLQDNFHQLTGKLSYSGPFGGSLYKNNVIAAATSTTYGPSLYGEINLTADFNNISDLGSISGYIDLEFLDQGNSIQSYSGRLNLERSAVGNSHSGFFDGNVSGTVDGKDYRGKWGGQFYGNNSSDGFPETVAGTMAATSSDGNYTIISPWAADKE